MDLGPFLQRTKLNLIALVEVLDNARYIVWSKLAGAVHSPKTHRNLTGRLAVVTGGNKGVGRATAEELLRSGSDVVLACRSTQLADAAAAELRLLAPYDGCALGAVEVAPLDLASLEAVRSFVAQFTRAQRVVHLLVCNAGVMALPERHVTKDGFETQFQVSE